MNCNQVENNILFYIDKELSNEMTLSFELHIAECQHCALLYQHVNASMQVIASENPQADDYYFYARLKQRMENKQLYESTYNYLSKKVLKPVAVFCLIAIGIFTGINIGNQYISPNAVHTAEQTRTSQLNAYSEETYIAEINNEKIESLFTSNQ